MHRGKRLCAATILRVQIRNQLTLKRRDHVLDQEFALFQAANAQLIHHRIMLQPIDQVVEISMADAQLAQPIKSLEAFGVDFLGHRHICY